jgi:hypothetical protein
MSQKYSGGFITKSPVAPTTSAASGIWTLDQQQQAQKAGTWPSPPIFIEDLFSTYLYTGTSATNTITNGIDLSTKGGLLWIKSRTNPASGIFHSLMDSARGQTSGYYNVLYSNTTDSQNTPGGGANPGTVAGGVTSFNTTGFTLTSGSSDSQLNINTFPYVSWAFAKQPKFFDVVTYTGNGTSGLTVAHNLGSVPGCIIVKSLTSPVDWAVYHTSLGATKFLNLNLTNAATTGSSYWNDVTPTSTNFTVGNSGRTNGNGETYVAYLFAHDAGGFPVSGGGSTNGITCGSATIDGGGQATVNLGYEPQWILYKSSSDIQNWYIYDVMRGMPVGTTSGPYSNALSPNATTAEFLGAAFAITPTGFNIQTSIAGATYIYIAIRRGPMKTPTVGTSVFSPLAISNPIDTKNTTNFPIDMQWWRYRAIEGANVIDSDRLRGISTTSTSSGQFLRTPQTTAENSGSNTRGWDNTGFLTPLAYADTPTVLWNWRRAPGYFDTVCYAGTNSGGLSQTITHNLGVAPELTIFKKRAALSNWTVAMPAIGGNAVSLNLNDVGANSNIQFINTYGASSITTSSSYDTISENTTTYVAYLFATVAGVSKVGSYTGTGALQTVNCGFTTGSRFVLIKRIDSTGAWYVWDSARGITAGDDPYILINTDVGAEVTNTNYVDTDTTGFKVTAAAPAAINANGGTYIFLAIA